jgi:glycosyltransferase involved in cell wall biosynthesis
VITSQMISLITICKNSASTIERTIASVLSQRNDVFTVEYIVIDGGSTDGTQQIVQSFGNAIDYFKSEPDNGIADAFNKGIARAHGDIIGIINSDDMLLPEALKKVMDYFDTHPEIEVLHGDILLYDDNILVKRLQPAGRWWYPWRIVLFNHPATFVRKTIYDRYGVFNHYYKYAMDVDLFARWMKAGVRIAYTAIPLARMQMGGASGKYVYRGFQEKRKALINNGFPSLVTYLHYISLFGIQLIVMIQQWLRRITTKLRSTSI